jgi:hypothetical protein
MNQKSKKKMIVAEAKLLLDPPKPPEESQYYQWNYGFDSSSTSWGFYSNGSNKSSKNSRQAFASRNKKKWKPAF